MFPAADAGGLGGEGRGALGDRECVAWRGNRAGSSERVRDEQLPRNEWLVIWFVCWKKQGRVR